jgi:hypothetical protein
MAEEGAPGANLFSFPSNTAAGIVRTYDEEMAYIRQVSDCKYEILPGFVPNMRVPGSFYVNDALKDLMFGELQDHCISGGHGGFLPAVKQIANVAALPGIVKGSIGLPDCHSGEFCNDFILTSMLCLVFLLNMFNRLRICNWQCCCI